MNLFEFFLKLTHPAHKPGWVETKAYFTGKTRQAARGKAGPYYPRPKAHYELAAYREYEVRFYTDDGERTGWYVFYPVPDPDPASIMGEKIKIRYKKSRPWQFESIEADSSSEQP